MTDKIYGIDLGTTYSCIACVDEYGRPVVVRNPDGAGTTPSVVRFDADKRIVGAEAKNSSELYPDAVVSMIKREMGTLWRKVYEGVDYSPEEISSYILRKLAADVELVNGEKVQDVVITVPAWFGIAERRATELAGELAGLTVRAILNEPTAAAFAFGLGQEKELRVLVYDLGGGTFDVTLIDIHGDTMDVVATGGNHCLGGRDWDSDIVTWLAGEWQASTGSGEDPLDSLETRSRLYREAEEKKRSLGVRDKVEIAVSHAGQVVKVLLTREKLEELTQARLEETIAHTRQTLKEAESVLEARGRPTAPLFHKLLLVGGSTKMPQVARRLRQELQVDPQSFDPDEAVAKGAALYGQKLLISEQVRRLLEARGFRGDAPVPAAAESAAILQVAESFGLPGPATATIVRRATTIAASRSYGVVVVMNQTRERKVFNLIKKNDKLPAEARHRIGTYEANQPAAVIQVMENVDVGKFAAIEDSREVGRAELSLPPGLAAGTLIEIACNVSAEGILQVTALDTEGRRLEVDLRLDGLLLRKETLEISARSRRLVVC